MNQEEVDTRLLKIQNKLIEVTKDYTHRLYEPDIKDLIFLKVSHMIMKLDASLSTQITVSIIIDQLKKCIYLTFHRIQ